MDALLQDLRYAIRRLLRTPAFTITVVLTLALGIGANSALFSIVNGMFWDTPVGVEAPEGLSWVSFLEGADPIGISYADYLAFRDRGGVFDEMALMSGQAVAVGGGDGAPERLSAELVSGNYFSVLRMKLALGRAFAPEEDRAAGELPVAVISHDLWRRRFGSRPDVLGSELALNGVQMTIVGVGPAGFRGLAELERSTDVWVPMAMRQAVRPGWDDPLELEYGLRPFYGFGRLREGTSRAQGRAPLQGMLTGWAEEFPESYGGLEMGIFAFRGVVGPQMRPGNVIALLLTSVAVTLAVLLIACGNVANLLLARAAGRAREVAVRAAIGASRARIVRQLLVESLVLAVLGGAAGVLMAVWTIALFERLASIPFPVPISLDARVVSVTFALSLVTGIVFGLSPALRVSKAELTPALKRDGGGGRERTRTQRYLISGQIALSFMLLVSAGLLLRNVREALATAETVPGRDQVLTVAFDLGARGYAPEQQAAFQSELIERVSAVGGVESASLTDRLPAENFLVEDRIAVDGRVVSDRSMETPQGVIKRTVWPGFFSTLEIALLRGRDFAMEDRIGTPAVVVVNEAAARRYWPGVDPVGRLIRLGPDTIAAATVIGVVADGVHDLVWDEMQPATYLTERQSAEGFWFTTLLVRTRGPASRFAPTLRALSASIDPSVALYDVRTIGQVFDAQHAGGRLASTLLLVFGALALVLAMIGLHGVVAYTVVQRTREMGIRIALGANGRQILSLFGKDTLRVAGYGVLVGLVLAAAASRVLDAAVRGLEAADALTVVGVATLLLAVAVFTSLLPARRATRVDPMLALRSE